MAPPAEFDALLRELLPRVLGAVARRFGDFAAAEDAVQEALLAAAVEWPRTGVPDNPGGWLHRVAERRYLDQQASGRARARRERDVAAAELAPPPPLPEPDDPLADARDDALALLFTCCHPALTPPSAVALTLRAVGGLSTDAIARAFLVPEATMAQRISRAKQTIAQSGVPFAVPPAAERAARLASVLHVLYLIFNEGYAASSGAELQRVDLGQEAIRLARALHALLPTESEVAGLLALLLLTDARRAARTDAQGRLVPLDEQDRTRWDRALLAEGTALVSVAMPRGPGAYCIQAAIAALHGEAADAAATDWPQILALYDVLLQFGDNPMVALNRTVAAAMVHGPDHGLQLLVPLAADPRLHDNHRVFAVRAHLLERSGQRRAAIDEYRAAALRSDNQQERDYLLAKAVRLEG